MFVWRCVSNVDFIGAVSQGHQFSSVQSLSRVRLFATPWIAARQASLSFIISWSLLKLMSTKLVMPSSHLILCRSLLPQGDRFMQLTRTMQLTDLTNQDALWKKFLPITAVESNIKVITQKSYFFLIWRIQIWVSTFLSQLNHCHYDF